MTEKETSPAPSRRPPAVAGQFYPGDATSLGQTVDDFLDQASTNADENRDWPKAVIAPHAGYIYSGPVAATAYGSWQIPARVLQLAQR